jgi:ATP-dependent protease Clp ATPase subunit
MRRKMFEDRMRILTEMGFICGNLAFDKLNKRVVELISDPINFTGNIYAPEIRTKCQGLEQILFIRDLFTYEMIPDIIDNLRKQLDGKGPVSARLKEGMNETLHEISLMLLAIRRAKLETLEQKA